MRHSSGCYLQGNKSIKSSTGNIQNVHIMKQIKVRIQNSWMLIMVVLVLFQPTASGQTFNNSISAELSSGCSVFTISKNNQVFFGGNDDYINPDSYYWVDPGDDQHYGAIWIGQPDNVQQGVNVHGLAYDANGLPRIDVNPHNERLMVEGGYTSYPIQILRQCTTVDEVITWIRTHRWHSFMHDQLHFADATGDAVIISVGADGELVFTRKPSGNGFLVSTNFNVAQPSNGFGYPCWRYNRAQKMLSDLVDQEEQLTVEDVAGVLDAVHVEGIVSWTIESLLADLSNGIVYIYYFYQFDNPIVLNVKEEVANPRGPGPLSKLFPDEVRQEAAERYQQIQDKSKRCRLFGMIWAALVFLCTLLFFFFSRNNRQGLRYWLPAIVILGPLAFVLWLIIGQEYKKSKLRATLIETIGDVMPSVFTFVIILFTLIKVLALQEAWLLQILIYLIMPVLLAWILFHGLLLIGVWGDKYRYFLVRRFPHVLVVTNLALGGISIVAIPLVNQSFLICSIMPLSAWTIVVFWIIVVIGSLPGGVLVFLYERWVVRQGFHTWNVAVWKKGDVSTPFWRKLWWWLLLSYIALLAGLAVGVILQQ